jgi:small nuclear ribonucleoprotein
VIVVPGSKKVYILGYDDYESGHMVMPLALMEKTVNKKVSLLLKDNRVLEGKLTGYDEYMNMVLEDTEERNADQVRRLGTVILRGNNVVSISPF